MIPRGVLAAATLAASSHNTQPWRLRASGHTLDILPDFSQRRSSIGCGSPGARPPAAAMACMVRRSACQPCRDLTALRSSAGVAVFASDRDEPAGWFETGRRYERFALEATRLGVRTAFMNQPVEVRALRDGFGGALGLSGRPGLLVRFGYGPERPRSFRRPLEAVLAQPGG